MSASSIYVFPYIVHRIAGLPWQAVLQLADDFVGLEAEIERTQQAIHEARQHLLSALDTCLAQQTTDDTRTRIYNCRKAFYQKSKITEAQTAMLFALPDIAPALQEWQTALSNASEAQRQFEQHFHIVLTTNWTQLQSFALHTEHFQRALLFASHDLLGQIPAFALRDASSFDKADRKTGFSVLRYLSRMVAKTSPLSRFTSVAATPLVPVEQDGQRFVFPWEEATETQVPELIAKVVPNVAFLEAIYAILLPLPVFYKALPLRLNPSLRRQKGRLSWWYFDGTNEAMQEAAESPLLKFVLEKTAQPLPYSALHEALSAALEDEDPGGIEAAILEWADYGLLEWQLPENGLNPSWCGSLYQFLGFLPEGSHVEAITDTAFLLQWLRTAARAFPFLSVAEGKKMQQEALRQLNGYFAKYRVQVPPIPPEQVFYEDTRTATQPDWDQEDVRVWCAALAQGVRAASPTQGSLLERMHTCWHRYFEGRSAVPLLDFAQRVLSGRVAAAPEPIDIRHFETKAAIPAHLSALVQPFRDERGEWSCVVNHLLPGGGKMIARWSHLLPEGLKLAHQAQITALSKPIFPYFGYYNANFQANFNTRTVAVPGGKLPYAESIPMADLYIRMTAQGQLQLNAASSGAAIEWTDLALEGVGSRPPTMQIALLAGLSSVQRPEPEPWQALEKGWLYRPRKQAGRLVWWRAAWQVSPEARLEWQAASPVETFRRLRAVLRQLGVPRFFFVRWPSEKPQLADQDSPVLMALFERSLHAHTTELLSIEECLPHPDAANKATEIVLEFAMG